MSTLVDVDLSTASGVQIVSPTPTGAGGAALNTNFTNIVHLIRAAQATIVALQTALAAKLPLTGGTLTGDLSLGSHVLNAGGVGVGSIGVVGTDSGYTLIADGTSFLTLFNGLIQVDLSTFYLRFNGNTVAMNDGSGAGGGPIHMDGGSLLDAGASTFIDDTSGSSSILVSKPASPTANAFTVKVAGTPVFSIGGLGNVTAPSITIGGALADGTYSCGTGSIVITNGAITAIT